MRSFDSFTGIEAIHEPSYTGENRCVPCTIVNLVIAIAVGGVVAMVSVPLAVVFVLVALATIYLRGYLVPGTPTLTQRYAPDRLLQWFGKQQTNTTTDSDGPMPRLSAEIGAESQLREVGALSAVTDDVDREPRNRIADSFWTAWRDRLDASETVDVADGVRMIFGPDADVTPVGGDLTAVVDGERLVGWESAAALAADVAASEALAARWEDWKTTSGADRQVLLSTLRAHLERCPVCDESLTRQETVENPCCGPTKRTITVRCDACETVVLDVTV